MTDSSALHGANAAFIDELYERYQADPTQVPDDWAKWFRELDASPEPASAAARAHTTMGGDLSVDAHEQSKVLELISAIRDRGHRQADLDPLGLVERPPNPDSYPTHYGFSEADLDKRFNTGSLFGIDNEASLREIHQLLLETYCGSIGTELTHITSTEEKRWVQEYLETHRGRPKYDEKKKRDILRWTTSARKLEDYLHRKYVGQKRFSLEGSENFIPAVDEVIQGAGEQGVKEVVIGMAHRGRLNMLVNILGKHPRVLFGEFEGKIDVGTGAGDVKYHMGFSSDIQTPGGACHLVLAFNPSHLEIINPVVEGSVRARQERRGANGGNEVLAITVHGDAAMAGQGVVTETLNLSETRGYGTGGTVHLVINNQIGFTTSDPLDSRSTLYCTDVAKLVQAPIFHVNGNDAEAVVFVSKLALEYRMRFRKDVVVDIVSFRRWGHNEADEPFATQPMMYTKIRDQHGPRRVYAEQLEAEGVISKGEADQLSDEYFAALEANQTMSRPLADSNNPYLADWDPYLKQHWRSEYSSSLAMENIESLGLALCDHPDDFELHRSVKRIVDARTEMAQGTRAIDWGFAENLAYAALLKDGYSVRISGQDSQRGTFFHRHAVMHNQKKRGTHTPLQHLHPDQPWFRVINSLLSEEAVLGFEYGYSSTQPESLVIWEAQFGDFANGAQVVVDQFLSSSESKWGRFCGLVMLLPHGYEGMGPEHSSARLERYLQLCAEENMQVVMPTTPAQIFHLLRRQMKRKYRKPLIVMSPKSLLRHRLATSTREELADGNFKVVIDNVDAIKPKKVTRLVLCSGKVFYDLLEKKREHSIEDIAIVRIEQLYPFPDKEINALLKRYSNATEICWAQEEPRNQGSWFFMLSRRHLAGCIDPARHSLIYAGRDYSASPAVGYMNVHIQQQRALVSDALRLEQDEAALAKSA
ncbi:MAG: 2-oxoglutarate dehydrogenase E1 component [Gammaproteobacteria bacterium]|jgi:2-oxoglutarate dehydrogenase E1 component